MKLSNCKIGTFVTLSKNHAGAYQADVGIITGIGSHGNTDAERRSIKHVTVVVQWCDGSVTRENNILLEKFVD